MRVGGRYHRRRNSSDFRGAAPRGRTWPVGEIAGVCPRLKSGSKDEADGQAGRQQALRGEEAGEGEARERALQRGTEYMNSYRGFCPEG